MARRERTPDEIRVRIKGSWTACPNRLLLDTYLSRDARLLGCLLFLHAGNGEKTFPRQEQLAAELTTTTRSIQRWLSDLRDAGWIEWRQTQKNNEYTLLDPSEPKTVSIGSSKDEEQVLSNTTPMSPSTIPVSYWDEENAVSSTTLVSSSNTTQGSPRATQGSPSNTTQGSSGATPVSCSTFIHADSLDQDSINTDSSSSDHNNDDDDDDDGVISFLREKGITAAVEFGHLDLSSVRERVEHLERDQRCTPGGIVANLRRAPPQARASGEASTLTDTERELYQRAAHLAEMLDATGLEYQSLLHELALGASDHEARTALEAKRVGRTQRR